MANKKTNYKQEMELLTKKARKLTQEASLSARATVTNELLTETPVDTGFLRNKIKVSAFENEAVIPSSDKTEEAVAALPFKGLSYQDRPSMAELSAALGHFETMFPNMKELYVSLPVEYAEILVNNPKYLEFHRKAAKAAQKTVDAETLEIFKNA